MSPSTAGVRQPQSDDRRHPSASYGAKVSGTELATARGMTQDAPVLAREAAVPRWPQKLLKVAAFLALLAMLFALGSGALDRWLSTRRAFASTSRSSTGAFSRASATTTAVTDAADAPAPAVSSAATSSSGRPDTPSSSSARTPDGRLILNLATEAELDGLPGIGARKAHAIVELRDKLGGRFKRLEELMRIRGLKRKAIERLRPLVVLDPP
ncbi:MAG: helix-hairpin-helix domain-containing protein [Polyangiaceae bacterium]